MYSPQLLDHFQNPRNAGEITDPDVSVQLENPACGDILKLTLRITDGRIAELRFRAKGCACHGLRLAADGACAGENCERREQTAQGRVGTSDRWPTRSLVSCQPLGHRRAGGGAEGNQGLATD